MKFIIPGGTGQVGTILAREFHGKGHEVVVLSRTFTKMPWKVLVWDAKNSGEWSKEFENTDVVINLAGRSVNCRYTPRNRNLILNSRVDSTKAVGNAIKNCTNPPKLWLQASTATIYSHRFDAPNDEATGVIDVGTNAPDTWKFSLEVANAWEKATTDFKLPQTRIVLLRSAMTMSPDAGGIFATLKKLVKCGLGGSAGNGQQYVSWVHEFDFIQAIYFIIQQKELSGPINISSPNPLPYKQFMQQLRKNCGVSIGLPATKWMLEIGAFFMQTETELILKSRRVIPQRLLDAGFQFKYPDWNSASLELCRRNQ